MFRLLPLLALGTVAAAVIAIAAVVMGVRRPRRATMGWALAKGYPCQPGAMGLHFEERNFPASVAWVPGWIIEGHGSRGTLLLLHGWSRSRIDSLRRLPPYLPHIKRAVLIDLRGHGDSPHRLADLSNGDLADVGAVLSQLAVDFPEEPLFLVGHSLGAALAIRAAAIPGARVNSVIAFSPYQTLRQPLAARLRLHHMPDVPLAWVAAKVIHLLSGAEEPTDRAASRLAVPLLVVAASGDTTVEASATSRIAEAAGSNCVHLTEASTHQDIGVHPSAELMRAIVQCVSAGGR